MIWLFALFLALIAWPVEAATRYFSPTGSLSACSSGTPCSAATAIGQAQCGDTLVAQDGTYTGANYMLTINTSSAPTATSCTGNRVTVQAENDGGALFDGEDARIAIDVNGVAGWTLTGMNAKRGWDGGTGPVVWVRGVSNVTLQRIVAYDAHSGANTQVFLLENNSDTVLMEDLAAFGTGQQMYVDFDLNTNVVWRRIFGRAEGNTQTGSITPDSGNGPAPNQFAYGGSPSIIENAIMTMGPDRGTDGFSYITNWLRYNVGTPFVRWYGGMHYPRTGLSNTLMTLSAFSWAENPNCSGYLLQDQIIHSNGVTSNPGGAAGMRPLYIANADGSGCSGVAAGQQQIMTRVLGIRSGGTSALGVLGTQTNVTDTTNALGTTGWDYTGTSNTPRLCFRYVDGVYTSTPLWPWPMDERIKAAITENGSTALLGTAGTGYTANTVTSEIVSIFGSIPSACNSGSAFSPSFPVASDFPNVAVIDTFDRANSSTLGANWTNIGGDVFTLASNQAAAPSSGFGRAMYSGSLVTASHDVFATWTTPMACCGEATALAFAATDLTGNNQYRVYANRQSGGNTLIILYKVDGVGGFTTIISAVDLGIDFAANDGLGARVTGTTVKIYWKYNGTGSWYLIGEAVDATLPTSNVYAGIAGATPGVINDFGAGPTPSEPPVSPPNPGINSGAGRFGTTFPGVR